MSHVCIYYYILSVYTTLTKDTPDMLTEQNDMLTSKPTSVYEIYAKKTAVKKRAIVMYGDCKVRVYRIFEIDVTLQKVPGLL